MPLNKLTCMLVKSLMFVRKRTNENTFEIKKQRKSEMKIYFSQKQKPETVSRVSRMIKV